MKKRILLIITAIVVLVLLIVLEIYIQHKWNLDLSYYERMLMMTSLPLFIAFAVVAHHDAKNLRNRREDPIDYVSVKGFRVREKRCDYGDESLAILSLYNQTRRSCTVTVQVTYLNVAGKVLGQETQTVIGFVRGLEKHLCFRPGRDFYSFSYTLETANYRGICHERNFRSDYFRIIPMKDQQSPEEPVPRRGTYCLEFHVTEEYIGTQEVDVTCTYILLDKENTVYGLHTAEPRRLAEPFPAHTYPAAEFDYPAKGEVPLSEELQQEGITGICIYTVMAIG